MAARSSAAKQASESKPEFHSHVDEAINAIMRDLVDVGGIGKDAVNQDEGWGYRSIEEVYKVVSDLMSKHCLYVIPEVVDREVTTRLPGNGYAVYNTALKMRFTIRSCVDGSTVEVINWGEATDPTDKGTNKALTSALKYMVFQLFLPPVRGVMDDADGMTPPKTNPAPAGSVQVPASNGSGGSKSEAPAGDKTGAKSKAPMDINEQAALSNEIAGAKDDVAALAAAKKLFGNLARIPKKESAQEMAREVVGKRSEFVGEDMVANFETMVDQFAKAKLLTPQESRAMINSARARLNLVLLE